MAARKIVDIARFRARREAAGLTQDELAKRAGVTRAAISHLETGKRTKPRHETVVAIDRALTKRSNAA